MELIPASSAMTIDSKIEILERKCNDLASRCEEIIAKTFHSESKATILTSSIKSLKRTYASLVTLNNTIDG